MTDQAYNISKWQRKQKVGLWIININRKTKTRWLIIESVNHIINDSNRRLHSQVSLPWARDEVIPRRRCIRRGLGDGVGVVVELCPPWRPHVHGVIPSMASSPPWRACCRFHGWVSFQRHGLGVCEEEAEGEEANQIAAARQKGR